MDGTSADSSLVANQDCEEVPTATTWGLLLEYQIPGRPKRLDAVLLDGAGIIAIEFKIGASEFRAPDKWQLPNTAGIFVTSTESEGAPIAPVSSLRQRGSRSEFRAGIRRPSSARSAIVVP